VGGYTKGALGDGPYLSGKDAYVVKLSKDGTILWTTTWGHFGDDVINALAVDSVHDIIYIAGAASGCWNGKTESCRANNVNSDAFVTKMASTGYIYWTTVYGTKYNDFVQSIDLDERTSNLYVTGGTNGNFSNPEEDLPSLSAFFSVLSMVDGSIESTKQWTAGQYSKGSSVTVDPETGYVYVTGCYSGSSEHLPTVDFQDMFLFTFNSQLLLNSTHVFSISGSKSHGTIIDSKNGVYYSVVEKNYLPLLLRYDLPSPRDIRPPIVVNNPSSNSTSSQAEIILLIIVLLISASLFGYYMYKKRATSKHFF
jgi:hypothetical protein